MIPTMREQMQIAELRLACWPYRLIGRKLALPIDLVRAVCRLQSSSTRWRTTMVNESMWYGSRHCKPPERCGCGALCDWMIGQQCCVCFTREGLADLRNEEEGGIPCRRNDTQTATS